MELNPILHDIFKWVEVFGMAPGDVKKGMKVNISDAKMMVTGKKN